VLPHACPLGQHWPPTQLSPPVQQCVPQTVFPNVAPPQQPSWVHVASEGQHWPEQANDGGLQHWPPTQFPGGGQHPVDVGLQTTSFVPQQRSPFMHLGLPAGQHCVLLLHRSPASAAQQRVCVAVLTRHVGVLGSQQLLPQMSPAGPKQKVPWFGSRHLPPANLPSRHVAPQQSDAEAQQAEPGSAPVGSGPAALRPLQQTVPELQCGNAQAWLVLPAPHAGPQQDDECAHALVQLSTSEKQSVWATR
jgi:hypothetical protein